MTEITRKEFRPVVLVLNFDVYCHEEVRVYPYLFGTPARVEAFFDERKAAGDFFPENSILTAREESYRIISEP
jgi:hypothetical protein